MNWIRNFRRLKSLAVLSIISSLILAMTAAGQSTRERRINDEPQQQQPEQTKQDPQKPKPTPEPEGETISISTNLVAVPVSVTDAQGNPVRNLTVEDFHLEEEGVPQQLQPLGDPGKTPIELALLFDVSRSIRNRFDFERETAGRFLKEILKPGDAVSVFSIGTAPKLSIPRTENAESAVAATASIQPTEDSTAFFDTVVKASQVLNDSSNPGVRRVMVVLSDGEDTNSERFRLGDAKRELQRADTLFYAINPSGPSIHLNKISTKGHEGMVTLAEETGGMAFLPDKIEDLTKVFAQITAELQAQYLLGYDSTNEAKDGKYRRITVRVPKRPDLRIRARQGYYAPKG
ncbi:MAG TPA: VWA domain-containing protein [Blastocatellia bacterium]|nr:VWA domain-containing protein [Blastocatellia bacterium]